MTTVKKIRQTMVSLDSDLIEFLEDMFDGDEHQPEAGSIGRKIAALEGQLKLFADQRLFRRKRQKRELQTLRTCEDIAHELLIELETLQNMKRKGTLNEENRQTPAGIGGHAVPDTSPETGVCGGCGGKLPRCPGSSAAEGSESGAGWACGKEKGKNVREKSLSWADLARERDF